MRNQETTRTTASALAAALLMTTGMSAQSPDGRQEITNVLQAFQDGYANRDTTVIEQYTSELFADDVVIVGTGPSEWRIGIEAASNLILWDWKHWGDVAIDIAEAVIRVEGSTAWFAAPGTLTRDFESEEYVYDRYGLQDIQRILDSEEPSKIKLMRIVVDAADILREVEFAGTTFVYPLRVSGSLVSRGGGWKFKQMTFSYPIPRRLIVSEARK